MRPEEIREIHVVANTHWDREFRDSFEKTRAKLVEMMDWALDLLERDPEYKSFTLDGQSIVAEDYLEMRPERRELLSKMLRERRLFLGPWFTLPDAMNIGAEPIVRNLLWGRRVAGSLGGEPMRAGYIPANWGQPSQLPQILRGFDIPSALIYRGISPHECPSEFLWRSPDGSEVIAHRFARLARYNWYYVVHRPATRGKEWLDKDHVLAESAELPVRVADGLQRGPANFALAEPVVKLHAEQIAAAVEHLLELEAGDASTPLFLAMQGHDISVAHPLDPEVVRLAGEALPGTRVLMSNLEDFMARVTDELDREHAVVLTGERRMNLKEGFWTYLLPGTISARTPLKVMNFQAETALTMIAEPLASLAWMHGADYPRATLDRAWRFLLSNHTHDAIAGCAPDAVTDDVAFRARQALDLADVAAEQAMTQIARRLAPPVGGDRRAVTVIAFNTLPFERREMIEVEVALPPGIEEEPLVVRDAEGNPCLSEEMSCQEDSLFVDNRWDVPNIAKVSAASLRVETHLPPLGHTVLRVAPEAEPPEIEEAGELSPGPRLLDNGLMRLEVLADGTVSLLHRETGRSYTGLGRFLDEGAVGTFWWPKALSFDRPVLSGADVRVEVVENGPLAATIRTHQVMTIPREAIGEDSRSNRGVAMPIETHWTLRRGDPLLRIEVIFHNPARDHRLRVLFPTGIATDHGHAGAHFDVVSRPIAHPDCTDWVEPFHATAPMQGFVDLSDGEAGLALLPHGLLEYEVFDDHERTLALTLIRSIPIRLAVSEEKQEVLPDVGPLCLGTQSFHFALYPHAGDHLAAACWRQAQRFNTPVRLMQTGAGKGALPPQQGVIAVSNSRVAVTAVKVAEAGDQLALRLFNPGDAEEEVDIAFGVPIKSAHRARLDETPLGDLPVKGAAVPLRVGPHRIETVLVTVQR
jgi:mannosylglycerate hydrolase